MSEETKKNSSELSSIEKMRVELAKRRQEKAEQEAADKKREGTYPHNDEHTAVYSAMGIQAKDGPIDRAWARLEDRGHTIGPAMTEEIVQGGSITVQYFMYAKALLNNSESNTNQTVVFTFGGSGKQLTESGL